jgi:hypothetical protein
VDAQPGRGADDETSERRRVVVIDDITAQEFWDPSWNDRPDPKRELAFNDPRVIGSEFRVNAAQGALLCVRRT